MNLLRKYMTSNIEKLKSTALSGKTVTRVTPVLLISSCCFLAVQPDLRLAVPLLIGVTAFMVSLLTVACYFGEHARLLWSPKVILAVALLLRFLFLFSPPQLSDDVYRYVWDGSNLLRGVNPYAAPPSDITPLPEIKAVHAIINHPDFITIYPPMSQLLFAGGTALGGTVTGFKTFLVLFDLGLCGLLVILLKQLESPPWPAVLYAWNPLPVLEIAGSGHVDGAGLTLLMGSICLLLMDLQKSADTARRRWPVLLSGVLLAGAVLVKLYPLVLTPVLVLLIPAPRRVHFFAGFIGALAALLFPFMPQLTNMAASLDAYAQNWEFAGFVFNTLRSLIGSGAVARILSASGFLLITAAIVIRLYFRLKRERSPNSGARQALEACYMITMVFLLLTPTLQPWYALSLAVFLPFCAGPAGLVLCWAVFLTYQVQIPYYILGQWIENPLVTAAVFLAPVTAHLLNRVLKKREWVQRR